MDMAEGAVALAASEDIAVQSAIMGSLSREDLATGMKLSAIAGQLRTARNVVAALDMPVLSDFLAEKSDELDEAATEQIFLMAATRALARSLAQTGADVADVGADAVSAGVARKEISRAAAGRAEELARSGEAQIIVGMAEMEAGSIIDEAARQIEASAVGEIAEGAEAFGQAEALSAVASELDGASKK